MIGNIFLVIALVAGIFTVLMYFLTYRGYQNTLNYARISFHTTAVMVMAASALLLHAILTHEYQYKYVYNYSNSELPTGLLISTFYAGQEGSFMLWALFSVIVGLILLDYTSKRGDLEPRVMMIYTLSITFLLIMVNPLLKSPFNYIWAEPDFVDIKNINPTYLTIPALQNFIFTDTQSNKQFIQVSKELYNILHANNIPFDKFIIEGKGLNPLLQNFWMQVHPPMLFIGFAMSAVPFAFALAALLKNDYKEWIKQALPWVLAGMMILGLAIMLGGYWAYGVLGWGGYWGWDPVENSSLVPWLIGVASIHTMLVQKKSQERDGTSRFVKTNLILCIMTYILVLYSTFLTRSGILGDASVHSFVDPGMTVYLFLLIFLFSFLILGVGMIFYRWKYLTEHFTYEENILSRELALFTGSVALIASAIIILVGTSAPIFGQTVDISFYNELNLPIAIIIGLLNGLSILLKWKYTDKSQLLKSLQLPIIASIILTAIIFILSGVQNIMLIILTFSSSFTFFVNGEIALSILKGRKSFIGAYIAHIGIALFLVGVVATGGYSKHQQVDLVKGEKVNLFGYELKFTGYKPIEGGKKYAFNVEIRKGNDVKVASPIMYIAEFNNSLMREPDILEGFSKDFYIAPISYDETGTENSNSVKLKKGETFNFKNKEITFTNFVLPEDMSAMMSGKSFKIGVNLQVNFNGKTIYIEPYMENTSDGPRFYPAELKEADLKVFINNMNASEGIVELTFASISNTESIQSEPKEILTIEASIKPFISLIWIGVAVTVIGFLISTFRRLKESMN
ncbi:MAG: cytochrome c biogenesis protein CcsA [Melioribacter sp.]|nr:cytochrome c biogenesis protein CcsA [Melioribacter sp.]